MTDAITRLKAVAVVVCSSVIFDLAHAGLSGWVYFPECPNGVATAIQQPFSLCSGAQSFGAFNQVARQLQGWQQNIQRSGINQNQAGLYQYLPQVIDSREQLQLQPSMAYDQLFRQLQGDQQNAQQSGINQNQAGLYRPQIIDSREQLQLQSSRAYEQLVRQFQGSQQNVQQSGINQNQPGLHQYRSPVIDSRKQLQQIRNDVDTQNPRAYQGTGDHERIRRQVTVDASQLNSQRGFQERSAMQSLAGLYLKASEVQQNAVQQTQVNQFVEPKNAFQESLYPYRAIQERNAMQSLADLYSQGLGTQSYATQQAQVNQFVEPNYTFQDSLYPYRSFPERNVVQRQAGLYPQVMGAQQYGIQQSQVNQLAALQNEFQESQYPLRYNTYGEAKPYWLQLAEDDQRDLHFSPSSSGALQMGQNMYGNLNSYLASEYNQLSSFRGGLNFPRIPYSVPYAIINGYCRCAPLCAVNCQQAEPMPVPQQASRWMNDNQLKARLVQFANQDLPTSHRSSDKTRITAGGPPTASETAVGSLGRKLDTEPAPSTPFLAPAAPPGTQAVPPIDSFPSSSAASASTTQPPEPSTSQPTQLSELDTSAPQPPPPEVSSSSAPSVASEAPPSQIEPIKAAQSALTYAPKAIKGSRSILED